MKNPFDITVSNGVYPPSEDTYLLLDAITIKPEDLVLDVGCGAGLASLAAAAIAQRVLSLDISLEAAHNARENLDRNHLGRNISIIQSDLFSSISAKTRFSLILFNPPYLPEDEDTTEIDHTLVGGFKGIEITKKFISEASQHLFEGGRIYVVVSSLADIEDIVQTFRAYGFDIEMVKEHSTFFEKIQVLRGIWRGHKETVL